MRPTAQRGFGGSRRPAALLSLGLTGALLIAGCATQVAGTAVAPSSMPASSTSHIASMPSGSPTTTPSDDGPSSSPDASAAPPTPDDTSTSDDASSSDDASTSDDASSSDATSSTTSSADSSAPSGPSVDPATFAAKLKTANAGVKSLKGSIAVTAASVKVTGTFGETIAAGHVNALDMSMFISEGSNDIPLRMIIVDDKIYVGGTAVLRSLDAGTKKWALAGATSKNAGLRKLAAQLDGYLDTASANQYELYAVAAKSVVDAGPERVGAIDAHRYDVTVDVAALAKASPASTRASMEALAGAGVSSLPASLWLDPSGRLVQSTSTVKVSGITSTSTFKVSAYNVAVSIKAPAAADVYTG